MLYSKEFYRRLNLSRSSYVDDCFKKASENSISGDNAKYYSVFGHKLPAFSLPEVLVVLVIIGILVLIALPNLMPLISKAKSTEAQQQLVFLHSLQKSHFYTYSKYCGSLDELGFEQQKVVSEGGTANYLIEIVSADEKGFVAKATAVSDFDGDGIFNVWEINETKALYETVKD